MNSLFNRKYNEKSFNDKEFKPIKLNLHPNNKKKVTFNEKISIILVDSHKKENKKNSISYDLIRENIKKVQNSNVIYQPKSQNCFVCNIF